jgi:hypothetical protein
MPLFIVMLNVGMMSAIVLNAFKLSVTWPQFQRQGQGIDNENGQQIHTEKSLV